MEHNQFNMGQLTVLTTHSKLHQMIGVRWMNVYRTVDVSLLRCSGRRGHKVRVYHLELTLLRLHIL